MRRGASTTTSAGYVMPVAYYPRKPDTPPTVMAVADFIVTHDLESRTVLAFRFYPQGDGYQSTAASTATFTTTATVYEGTFLRLTYNTTGGMTLSNRYPNTSDWRNVGTVDVAAYVCTNATCFVYTSAGSCVLKAVCCIQLASVDDAPPCFPEDVLPCKYVVVQPKPSNSTSYVYAKGVTAIKTDWRQGAWQALKWGPSWTSNDDAMDGYNETVDNLENGMRVVLTPGQLVPIAYKPYYATSSPSFPGEVACVVTSRIPPRTNVSLYCYKWLDGANVPTYSWESPGTSGVDAGTVLVLGGLGTSPRATYGSLVVVNTPLLGKDMTAFTLADASGTYHVTAVYSCSYRGKVPRGLQPGVSLLAKPWPDGPSILCIGSCKPICNWLQEMIALNALCPTRWLCQPLPAFRCCERGCGCSCSCGPGTPPSMFTTTTPLLGGGCGGR